MEDNTDLKAEIVHLKDKLNSMRKLLHNWNPYSMPVWEHPSLKHVGETKVDYAFLVDENDGPDMPLFDVRYDDNLWLD